MPAQLFLPRELYGIIGHPLGHTMSPLLHNWGFGLLDIPAVYMAWPLEPGRVGDFITAVRTLPIRGASVTIPHKQAVLPLLDGVSDRARAVGAVNTLYWRDGRLLGENTDVTGFLAPLRQRAAAGWRCARALVLGNGGAARAVLAGLHELGPDGEGVVGAVAVTGRNPEKAAPLAAEFGAAVVDWDARGAWGADLVVNTTPMGMSGERQGDTAYPAQGFAAQAAGGAGLPMILSTIRCGPASFPRPLARAGTPRTAWPCSWSRGASSSVCGPAVSCPPRARAPLLPWLWASATLPWAAPAASANCPAWGKARP
nr:shikimate 5-dehydrogenase I alpha [Nitratidesulfovibrio sp. HK-II]